MPRPLWGLTAEMVQGRGPHRRSSRRVTWRLPIILTVRDVPAALILLPLSTVIPRRSAGWLTRRDPSARS